MSEGQALDQLRVAEQAAHDALAGPEIALAEAAVSHAQAYALWRKAVDELEDYLKNLPRNAALDARQIVAGAEQDWRIHRSLSDTSTVTRIAIDPFTGAEYWFCEEHARLLDRERAAATRSEGAT